VGVVLQNSYFTLKEDGGQTLEEWGMVKGKTMAVAPFPSEWGRGQEDELFEFNCSTSDCCAGKGIDIINGDETIKTTWSSDIYESISTSFLKSNVNSFFYIGISKRDNRQDKVSAGPPLGQPEFLESLRRLKQCGRVGGTFGDDP